MNNKKFAHLHCHSEYSQLDGLGTTDAYAKKASEMGFEYLSLTDHGCIDGLIEFQKSCNKYNIKPILGCEAYIVPDATIRKDKTRGHITLFVKNEIGFSNLCRLLTYANLEGFYYKPRIDYNMLLSHCEGLVIATACASSFLRKFDNGVAFFYDLFDKIQDDLYLEIMPHQLKEQQEVNKIALRLSLETGCKIIATNDCHYIERSHWEAHEILLAIQTKAKWNDPKRWKFSIKNLYLCSAKEMWRRLRKIGLGLERYLTNTIEVARKCNFKIPKQEILLPRVKGIPLRVKEDEFLMNLCIKGFSEKNRQDIKDNRIYYNRLKEELSLITQKKFARYFLIAWELVHWCKINGILVGSGRGSVGGSLTAFLLNITTIDPIKHGLLFSRFINKERIDYPDIDIDFDSSKRYVVKQHLETMYGEDHIANVSSFNRMKSKGVIRDVSRVFDIPLDKVDRFTKLIENSDEHTGIQEAINNHEEGKQFNQQYPKIVKFAQILEGSIKNYGSHAAALIISREPLTQSDRCNLIKRNVKGEETILINWEKNNADYVGLMKLDALALKLLSIFSETKELIKQNYHKDIDLDQINIDDPAVLKEINDGHTTGLFQLNTYAMTTLIKEMGIKQFADLSDAMALVRPGPSASGMTEEYVKRKHGMRWKKHHRIYERITKKTYGVIVYQEQIMKVINKMAGLPYAMADEIRKIIGKKRSKKEFAPYKKKFIKGCLKQKTFSKIEAEEFWTALQEHAHYSFNEAHSTAYAILGMQSGWLKKYYPTEFICASLTYGSQAKKPLLIEEGYRLGLTLVLPKVGISDATRWVAKSNKLYIPFQEVKGIGMAKAHQAATITPHKNIQNLFFTKASQVRRHKGAFGKLLTDIGAYNLNDAIRVSDKIQSYFDFRIVTDPHDTYKNLYNFFDGKIRLDRIDKILSGNLKEIAVLNNITPIVRKITFKGHSNLLECTACKLREECQAPVCPSPGKYNVMIIGEAPGLQEDNQSKGFVGKSGDIIWKFLEKRKYRREDFHISNVVKCFPRLNRTPNPEQMRTCSKFLKYELEEIQPKIILSFGNATLNFFAGRSSGISSISGKIIWNEEYAAWVVYCIHPAATLHNPANKQIFKMGMKAFCSIFKTVSKKILK
jgi:DNA polymerase-3 subunit alpha